VKDVRTTPLLDIHPNSAKQAEHTWAGWSHAAHSAATERPAPFRG
jgi:hypothetical protein